MSKSRKKITLHIENCENGRRNGLVDKKEVARRRWGLLARALKVTVDEEASLSQHVLCGFS